MLGYVPECDIAKMLCFSLVNLLSSEILQVLDEMFLSVFQQKCKHLTLIYLCLLFVLFSLVYFLNLKLDAVGGLLLAFIL